MNDETFEYAASEYHARWFQKRWGKGIMSEKTDEGEELMKPYESLSESAKEIFRKQTLLMKIFS